MYAWWYIQVHIIYIPNKYIYIYTTYTLYGDTHELCMVYYVVLYICILYFMYCTHDSMRASLAFCLTSPRGAAWVYEGNIGNPGVHRPGT